MVLILWPQPLASHRCRRSSHTNTASSWITWTSNNAWRRGRWAGSKRKVWSSASRHPLGSANRSISVAEKRICGCRTRLCTPEWKWLPLWSQTPSPLALCKRRQVFPNCHEGMQWRHQSPKSSSGNFPRRVKCSLCGAGRTRWNCCSSFARRSGPRSQRGGSRRALVCILLTVGRVFGTESLLPSVRNLLYRQELWERNLYPSLSKSPRDSPQWNKESSKDNQLPLCFYALEPSSHPCLCKLE